MQTIKIKKENELLYRRYIKKRTAIQTKYIDLMFALLFLDNDGHTIIRYNDTGIDMKYYKDRIKNLSIIDLPDKDTA